MIQNYEFIISKILSSTPLSREEVEAKIDQKLKELQGLISKEGAAHIIANELNVKILDSTPRTLKIRDVTVGLMSVTVTGKIITVYETRNYQSGMRSGRIASLLIGDETGTIRIVVWDEHIIDSLVNIKEGDIFRVRNAYVKQNNNFKELHLGNKAQIEINPEGESIGEVKLGPTHQRTEIKNIVENQFIETYATIIQIFEPRFYQACPVCNKKATTENNQFLCQEHGKIVPKQVPIVNLFLDDGTANIRAVCFREQAEWLIGKGEKNFDDIKKDVVGKQVIVRGRTTKNELFGRIELTISNMEEADPDQLIADLEQAGYNKAK